MATIQRFVWPILLVCGFPAAGFAQQPQAPSNRFYFGVGLEISAQKGGDSLADQSPSLRLSPGVGGAGFGTTAIAGLHVSKLLSIAVEGSLPTRFQSIQEMNYMDNRRYDNRHREPSVSALLVVHTGLTHMVRPEWAFGVSYIREDTTVRESDAPFASTAYGPYSSLPAITRDTWAITIGSNVPVQLANHIQLVPQVRLYWADRAILDFSNQSNFASSELDLGRLVFRAALGLRLSF